MKNVLLRRGLPLVICAVAAKVAGPNNLGPIAVVGGCLLIAFSLVVLPGWWLKFREISVTIVQLPNVAFRRSLEYEIAASNGQGVLFEYCLNGAVMQGSLDRRWPSIFRPFAGSWEALEDAQKALVEKRTTTAYIQEGSPNKVYLVVKTDWAMVYLGVFLAFLAILLGIGFSL